MGKHILIIFIIVAAVFTYSGALHAKKKNPGKSSKVAKVQSKKQNAKKRPSYTAKKQNKSSRKIANLAPMTMGDEPRGPQQPLQVKGQARQLSMMLVLKNEKDSINFVRLRTDYQKEIVNTEF
jgi:anionic cell wall polymer biosynthesis LytR-Cps2A-Psr (LCP) family protein